METMNMFERWIDAHPWMTFILGVISLLTLNTFFISIGGGYKKFPSITPIKEEENKENSKILLD